MKSTIGFFQRKNDQGDIENSSNILKEVSAAFIAFILAILIVLPWITVTLGDGLPLIITLLAYSLGNATFKAGIAVLNKPKS